MLARCHSPKLTKYLHHLDYQPAFLRRSCLCDTLPLPFPSRIAFFPLSYITTTPLLSTPYADNAKAIAAWNGKRSFLTPDNDNDDRFQPFKNHTSRQKSKMDSMPVRGAPVPSAVKIPEPETKAQHVEHVNASANINLAHHEHLPKGIAETEEERRTRWFIGSIDCGTTSSRFLIFDGEGTPIASHQIEFENIYPESG
jgi:hypothetical protein